MLRKTVVDLEKQLLGKKSKTVRKTVKKTVTHESEARVLTKENEKRLRICEGKCWGEYLCQWNKEMTAGLRLMRYGILVVFSECLRKEDRKGRPRRVDDVEDDLWRVEVRGCRVTRTEGNGALCWGRSRKWYWSIENRILYTNQNKICTVQVEMLFIWKNQFLRVE